MDCYAASRLVIDERGQGNRTLMKNNALLRVSMPSRCDRPVFHVPGELAAQTRGRSAGGLAQSRPSDASPAFAPLPKKPDNSETTKKALGSENSDGVDPRFMVP
jgi:hypothetical protein